MQRKALLVLVAVVLCSGFAAPARAQSQAVSFNIGGFFYRGDVNSLPSQELTAGQIDQLAFNISDFNSVTFGGEWLIALSPFLEASAGVAYYSKTVPSVSANYVNTDGSEIQQSLHLRIVPITGTIRFLPLGRRAAVEPYVGGGIAIMPWHYSEEGQFVASDLSVYTANPPFVGTGTSVGAVILGGAHIPFGKYAVGGEVRWQSGKGNLPTDQFIGPNIDLGGFSIQGTFVVRFGGR